MTSPTLRIVSVGRKGGPILWIAVGDQEPQPLQLTDAQAFALVDQLVRTIQFPEGDDHDAEQDRRAWDAGRWDA